MPSPPDSKQSTEAPISPSNPTQPTLTELQKEVFGANPTSSTSSIKNSSPADSHPSPDKIKEDEPSENPKVTQGEMAGDSSASQSAVDGPPLPDEPVPEEDDGWDYLWSAEHNSWYFFNRFTQQSTWENPRVPVASTSASAPPASDTSTTASAPPPPPQPVAGGYNPAIHGDFDPNADYAQSYLRTDNDGASASAAGGATDPSLLYVSGGFFNRGSGKFQQVEQGVERHTDEAKSRRQMNAFFDVDAAANAHDGRSLKAERSGKKPSRSELKAFKEKRKAKKEEKRRAWLRD